METESFVQDCVSAGRLFHGWMQICFVFGRDVIVSVWIALSSKSVE